MKKKCLNLILMFIIQIVILLSLSACSDSPVEPTTSACILYGNTRNVGFPDYDNVESEIDKMAKDVTDCSVIVLDGDADTISYENIIRYPKSLFFLNKDEKYKKEILKGIAACKPDTDEIDIINALRNAENKLCKSKTKNKRIVIFSSGISTTGVLNFAKNPKLIEEDPSVIVDMLKKAKVLPNLNKVKVTWYGLGVVESPQKDLKGINEQRLKNIWNVILKECNAEIDDDSIQLDVGKDSKFDAEEFKKDFPKVSVVEFSDVIELDETKVEFKPESAAFSDTNKVYKELEPYARLMMASGSTDFYVVGSTASYGSNSGCLTRSIERADAVKKVLCDFGVPSSYLNVFGIGRENFGGNYEWRVNDLNSDGSLNSELAPQNRKVMIFEKDSYKGRQFKEIWDKTLGKKI